MTTSFHDEGNGTESDIFPYELLSDEQELQRLVETTIAKAAAFPEPKAPPSPFRAYDLADDLYEPALAADNSILSGSGRHQLQPPPLPTHVPGCDDDLILRLSQRAQWESRLVDILPSREFQLDEAGLVDFCGLGAADLSASGKKLAELERPIDPQVEELLPAIKSTFEQVMGTSWQVDPNDEEDLTEAGAEQRHRGSEPRPSLAKAWSDLKEADEGGGGGGGVVRPSKSVEQAQTVDDHYHQLCRDLRLPSSEAAARALQVIGLGGAELPKDLASKGYLGNRGAQALFLALASCPAHSEDCRESGAIFQELRRLDLSGQGLGNEAALALAELLPKCPALQSMDVSRNHISEKAAQRLVQAVELHPTIEEVKIDANPIPSWLRIRLQSALRKRKTIRTPTPNNS